MKKHYNKRWLEQRWDARQPERLAHIKEKRFGISMTRPHWRQT